MGSGSKIKRLVIQTAKIEQNLPRKAKLKLAQKRLAKLAGLDVDEIKTRVLENKVDEKKEEVITKFEMMNDIKDKTESEPNNKTLREELDRKQSDLEFAVEDLARAEKEKKGGDPLGDEMPHIGKYKKAGTDNPQEYGNGFGQADKTDVSAQIMEDKNVKKIIDDMDDKERNVFEAAVRRAVKRVK